MVVEVAYAMSEMQWVVRLDLDEGSLVADALQAVAQQQPFSDLPLDAMPVGVFGEVVETSRVLHEFDRVEIYRPLAQDPKAARLARAAGAE